jgi:hypothetical protein
MRNSRFLARFRRVQRLQAARNDKITNKNQKSPLKPKTGFHPIPRKARGLAAPGLSGGTRARDDRENFEEEKTMSEKINPEAMEPSTEQAFFVSDRNPAVTEWGGSDAEGGQIPSPPVADQRVTPDSPVLSPDTGLKY